MKKDVTFVPVLLVIGVLLGLLKATGMTVHIILSAGGVIVLAAYTIITKKDWKIPALEIGMRISYGIALISGIVLKIKYIAIIGVFHKIFGVLFVVTLVVLFIHKLITRRNK